MIRCRMYLLLASVTVLAVATTDFAEESKLELVVQTGHAQGVSRMAFSPMRLCVAA